MARLGRMNDKLLHSIRVLISSTWSPAHAGTTLLGDLDGYARKGAFWLPPIEASRCPD